jgi:glycosyltransferase involved in cell wall biosynthesis
VARLVGRPHVWHAREIVSQSALALRVERALARHGAKTVAAVSEAVAAQLDRRNVEIVRDDPDPSRFRPGSAGRFRHRVGIDDSVLLVGSVARLDTWKGFDTFLDALELVLASRDDVEGLVGGGPVPGKEAYAARLEARAAEMRSVHWVGERDDVAELLADLDVLVQVSETPEPYGLVVAEALASGTPVVAGDQGGPVEILAGCPSHAGRLVPPGDPGALATAVLELLPSGPSGSAKRRARPVLREPAAGSFLEVMSRVADRGCHSARLGR